MNFNSEQLRIIDLLKDQGRLSKKQIAEKLQVTKSDLESDLALLLNLGVISSSEKLGYFYQGSKNYIVFAEILKYYSVENIMSMPVIVEDTTSIYDTIVFLFLENVGSIYITKNLSLVGVVSRKDLLKAAISDLDLKTSQIKTIMTKKANIKKVSRTTSVYECAKTIIDAQIDGVPVVENIDGKEKVVGRVTKTNITSLFVKMGYNYDVEELL
ncbi:MAG: CBS domain-containing protein [Bacillota bacterium]|nr:CBS domain-containing protein [Bacillota bacterium]